MVTVGEFRHTDVLAILRWKQGERAALATYRPGPNRLHVLFDMPPAGDFDHEEHRPLTPTEHIKLFGRRLRDVWGNQIAFVDAAHVDDELHRGSLSQHPLTELLERARSAGALACPVVSLSHSAAYWSASRRFAEWRPELPVCVRIESTHLDRPTFHSELRSMLDYLRCAPSRCFLVLDFKDTDLSRSDAHSEIVEMIADRIAEFPYLHNWKGFAIALSSFPATIKLKPGQLKEYPRSDLSIYGRLIVHPTGLLRTPMYGDYALDTSAIERPQRRTPSAHLRYSTPSNYVVVKGTSVKKPHGYEAIFPVADLLVSQPCYAGPSYSDGDAFIEALHKRRASTGTASSWRWASTDHHLTSNVDQIAEIYGFVRAPTLEPVNSPSIQGELFASDLLASSKPA